MIQEDKKTKEVQERTNNECLKKSIEEKNKALKDNKIVTK